MTEIPPNLEKLPKYPPIPKNDKNTPDAYKKTKIPPMPTNDQNTLDA